MNFTPTVLMRFAAIALITLLCACGGGGGGQPSATGFTVSPGAGPQAPTLTLTPTAAKTFLFTWTDVAGETEYRLLEDPDGASGYAPVGQPLPADTTQFAHDVFLPARINARYILQACNGGTCLDSAPVSVSGPLVEAIGFLKSSVPAAEDGFGFSVALSANGSTLAVGAWGEDSQNTNSGAVYVFTRQGQAWQQQAFVKSSTAAVNALFGYHLALDALGTTLAVGAPGEDGAGAAYVFVRQGGTWAEQQRITASNSSFGSAFGVSLALSASGDALVVGDPWESSITGSSGAAYVLTRSGDLWTEQTLLKASSPQSGDAFGMSVSVSGNGSLVAVGAPEDSSAIFFGGAVYVFEGSGPTWGPPTRLTADPLVSEHGLGAAVVLSRDGNTLAAGALRDDSVATGIDGDASAGGAPGSGAVHVFSRQGMAWTHQAYLKPSNTGEEDNFGRGLSISDDGNVLAVGAPYERSTADGLNGSEGDNTADVGAAYVFRRQGGTWQQQAYVKASNSGGSDTFGWGLALSGDGLCLAVGAPGESSAGNGWGAVQNNDSPLSGAVYLY